MLVFNKISQVFEPEILDIFHHIPGPKEVMTIEKGLVPAHAVCMSCKPCNPLYLQTLILLEKV